MLISQPASRIFRSIIMTVYFLVIEGRRIFPTNEPKLILQPNPSRQMCTIYIKQISTGVSALWQKVIFDNKDTSLLCIVTHGNYTIPDPTIRFLEACTFYILVGNTNPYTHIENHVLVARPVLHSKVIVVTNDNCSYFPYKQKNVEKKTQTQMFLYFSSCPKGNTSTFPNAYIDIFKGWRRSFHATWITLTNKYSVYDSEPPLRTFNNYDYMFVMDVDEWHSSFPYLIDRYCNDNKPMIINTHKTRHCYQKVRFYFLFQSKFNLTLTWDREILSAGILIQNSYYTQNTSQIAAVGLSKTISIFADRYLVFFYCLLKPSVKSFTVEALISSFAYKTWIALLAIFCILLCLKVYPKHITKLEEKISHIMRLLLEQGIILETYTGVAICFSFSIIIFIYKMQLVSELLVPNKVAPKNNLSLLANEGYKYLHDGLT